MVRKGGSSSWLEAPFVISHSADVPMFKGTVPIGETLEVKPTYTWRHVQYMLAMKIRDNLKHAEATCTSTVAFRSITPRRSLAAGGSTTVRKLVTSLPDCVVTQKIEKHEPSALIIAYCNKPDLCFRHISTSWVYYVTSKTPGPFSSSG